MFLSPSRHGPARVRGRRHGPALDPSRLATTATFVLSGFVFASWAVRIPDVSVRVGASHEALGTALLCLSLGALATMRLAGALCERLGPGRVTTVAAALLSCSVVLPGIVASVSGLALALLVFGAATGMLNVAMNSVGVHLEKAAGRAILPSLHAAFSLGGLGGSVVGGLAGARLGPPSHLLLVALAGLLVTSTLAGPLAALDHGHSRARSVPGDSPVPAGLSGARGLVLTLGAVAACTAYGEGALSDWAALHLTADLHSGTVVAATGYAGFSLAMAVGRLAGHRLLVALGTTRLLVGGATLASAGMLVAALSPHVVPVLAGLVLVGLGLANLFPVAIARAGALAGPRGVGLASTVGYGGLLAGPALIGFLSARSGLPAALTSVSALSLLAAGLAFLVERDPASDFAWRGVPAQLRSRLVTWFTPLAGGIAVAAERQMAELVRLAPGHEPGPVPAHAHTRDASSWFLDLDELLGASRRAG